MMILAIVCIPWYRLEMIRYTELRTDCYESWIKDRELNNLDICSVSESRERFKDRVDCDGAKKNVLLKPYNCAYRKWCETFFPVVFFRDIYYSLAGTWYIYGLTASLLLVICYTLIISRTSLEKRKLELRAQSDMYREFSSKFVSRDHERRHYLKQSNIENSSNFSIINKAEGRTGGLMIDA